MAKASEQFRQSDVTLWGVAALVCAGLAVFGSNIALLVPQSIIGGLHQPRVAGASIETLRSQVASLVEQTNQLKRENEVLVTRFGLQEKSGTEVIRRVGALEVSVPRLLEQLPEGTLVDRQSLTASIGNTEATSFDAQGGTVSVRQVPLPQAAPTPSIDPVVPPMPAPVQTAMVTPNQTGYGIAIGAPVAENETDALWSDLTLKLGPLLFGMSPLVTDDTNSPNKRIVVGPLAEAAEASALCQRFEHIAIACTPAPYVGTPFLSGQ